VINIKGDKMKFPQVEPKSKTYLKLTDGSSVIGVFRGEIDIIYQVYENGRYKTVSSTDANGIFRFNVNFIVKENGMLVAKIFQGNYHDFKTLEEINSQMSLDTTYIKLTQTGERQSKRISFTPQVKSKPDEAKLSLVTLNILGKPNYDDMAQANDDEDDEAPF
jgi:hypothetical protein